MPYDATAEAFAHAFVCGCGHSGTTLVAKMLGRHADVYAFSTETEYFLGTASTEQVRLHFRETIYPPAEKTKARVVCEKTPRHVYFLERAREAFPDARFVIPIRDARDVALSIKLRSGSLSRGWARWSADNAVVRGAVLEKREDVHVFKYEDLIEDTAGTLAGICAHLRLAFDKSMLEYTIDERRWSGRWGAGQAPAEREPPPSDHRNFRDWQVRQPLMDRRGRWRTMLEPSEIAEVEHHCGELMRVFGYERSDP